MNADQIAALSPAEKIKKRDDYRMREIARCRDSFSYFLFNYVQTKDEHDRINPVKAFPQKDYLVFLAKEFEGDDELLYIAKSRQLMVSWILCAKTVHTIMFRAHALVCFQSKKLEDAAAMVYDTTPSIARTSFILQSLPEWMRVCVANENGKNVIKKIPFTSMTFSYGQIKLPNGSIATALAQGAAQVEGKVPTLFISDESSLQEEWRSSWTAMRPCISGGGRAIAVATMRLPSAYGEEVATCDDVDPDGIMRGVAYFKTVSGGKGIRLHYSADPDKDPATETGAAWYTKEVGSVLGGRDGAEWQQHYEINPESRSGRAVLPFYEKIESRVVVPDIPFDVARTWRLDAGFDWGVANKTVWQVFGQNYEGETYMLYELAVPAIEVGGVTGIAGLMKKSPYFPLVNGRIYADPTIWNKTQSDRTASVVSNAVLFRRLGVHLAKARLRGQEADELWLNRILGNYWFGPEEPGFRPKFFICQSCRETVQHIKRLRYKEWSAGIADTKSLKEEFAGRQVDWLDAWKYRESADPRPPTLGSVQNAPAYSFDWLLRLTRQELDKHKNARS